MVRSNFRPKFKQWVMGMLLIALASTAYADQLTVYPEPAAVTYTHHNDDYTVRVRTPNGPWQDLYEYNVKVDLDKPQDASMVYFDFSGTVEVSIRLNNGDLRSVRVRPLSYGIKHVVKGNTVFFTLREPRKLSVEFNGDKLHNLHVFANPIETNRPDPNDPNVIWFGPGVHELGDKPGAAFSIPSGKTVYIAGGAMVRGKLLVDHAHDVKILGRGILEQPERGFEVTFSSGVTIDGPIVVNPKHYTVYCGQSDHLTIRNLKTFSTGSWTDGLDFMSCSDVDVDDVFLRTSDDSIAIYGHRWDFYGDARNFNIRNSTLWADVAHPTNIGLHGDTSAAGETIENITFHNIDILEHDEDDPPYRGCLAINAGDHNLVRNVTYDDIRIEDFEEGQLLNLQVVYNAKYNTGPGRGIENILFRNIRYTGSGALPSHIDGFDETHAVRGVRFEGMVINGRKILHAKDMDLVIGPYAHDVTFQR